MWWASGSLLAPTRTASLVASGTITKVVAAATPPTMAKDSTDGTASGALDPPDVRRAVSPTGRRPRRQDRTVPPPGH